MYPIILRESKDSPSKSEVIIRHSKEHLKYTQFSQKQWALSFPVEVIFDAADPRSLKSNKYRVICESFEKLQEELMSHLPGKKKSEPTFFSSSVPAVTNTKSAYQPIKCEAAKPLPLQEEASNHEKIVQILNRDGGKISPLKRCVMERYLKDIKRMEKKDREFHYENLYTYLDSNVTDDVCREKINGLRVELEKRILEKTKFKFDSEEVKSFNYVITFCRRNSQNTNLTEKTKYFYHLLAQKLKEYLGESSPVALQRRHSSLPTYLSSPKPQSFKFSPEEKATVEDDFSKLTRKFDGVFRAFPLVQLKETPVGAEEGAPSNGVKDNDYKAESSAGNPRMRKGS